MSRFGACSARISGDTHTDTQNDYRNPRCACAPRVNYVARCELTLRSHAFSILLLALSALEVQAASAELGILFAATRTICAEVPRFTKNIRDPGWNSHFRYIPGISRIVGSSARDCARFLCYFNSLAPAKEQGVATPPTPLLDPPLYEAL